MNIAAIENIMIDRIKTHFDGRLKAVESVPIDFDVTEFKRILRLAPGVFICFGFGPAIPGGQAPMIQGRWVMIAVTTNAGGELNRRHGSKVEIGAYEIMQRLIPLMHGFTVEDVGTLTFSDSNNLFTGELEKEGAAAYAAIFTMPMAFELSTLEQSSLDDFIRFNFDLDVAPTDGVNEIQGAEVLEQ